VNTEHLKVVSTDPDEELIAKLRLDVTQVEAVVKVPITLQCRKPPKQEFIRVHPEFELTVGAIELKDESDGGFYIVASPMMAALGEEAKGYSL
jgi:hypothetical protein